MILKEIVEKYKQNPLDVDRYELITTLHKRLDDNTYRSDVAILYIIEFEKCKDPIETNRLDIIEKGSIAGIVSIDTNFTILEEKVILENNIAYGKIFISKEN